MDHAGDDPGRNEIVLVGRLAAPAQQRCLPSGDLLGVFRLIVSRPAPARTRGAQVDTFDCVVRTAALRRKVLSWAEGDVLEVEGALRRRFWRTPHGPTSRCEIEVASVRRVVRARAA